MSAGPNRVRWSRNRPALFRALIVAVCSLALGGCVYLRLLQVKNQLAKFDKYFEADTRDGLKLTFKEPVMLDQDFEEFFKWSPESRQKAGTAEKWHFRWLKERVPADGERPPYAIEFDFLFAEHKLAKFIAPEAFLAAFMPKKMLLLMLRSVGGAKIDQANRSASTTVASQDVAAEQLERPTLTGLKTLLGEPVEITGDEVTPLWRYRFQAASPQQRMGQGGIDVTFTIDPASRTVRSMKGRSMGMSLSADFGEEKKKEKSAEAQEKAAAPAETR